MFDQAQRHGYRNTSNIQRCKNICSTNTNIFRRYKFQLALKVPADVHVIFLNVLKQLFFHVRPVSCIPPHRLTPKSQHTITLITAQLITPLHHTNLSPHSLSPYFSHPTHTTSSHHHFITPTYPYHHTASLARAGAVHRASWRSCCARGRHWPAAGCCVAGAVHRAFWRSCWGCGRRWPVAGCHVAGAVHRAFWRSCCARGRRWPAAG